ncbi:hypothetical protein PM10SUCC1_32600 [Propionigenium maris DSM 9537]|uniref:Uncharacterized protein n=1 Tax=Propionigenium maris DSM 9537 TaxID=1123000 RepID=A0A9W6GPN7_9FUSO|nr:hypothetical protein [Propionigenium maris]GLI57746.1 hypothetical protein PM10SUCC1_32600 [Propionigenium maris DSM 9537]
MIGLFFYNFLKDLIDIQLIFIKVIRKVKKERVREKPREKIPVLKMWPDPREGIRCS